MLFYNRPNCQVRPAIFTWTPLQFGLELFVKPSTPSESLFHASSATGRAHEDGLESWSSTQFPERFSRPSTLAFGHHLAQVIYSAKS